MFDKFKAKLNYAIEEQQICRVLFSYDDAFFYFFPLETSEDLFLSAIENDFMLDGFTIRKLSDIRGMAIKNDKCRDIDIAEGLLENLVVPDVDISDWHSVFTSLYKIGENIIVEKESEIEEESQFAIGRIIAVSSDHLLLHEFDADGIWLGGTTPIPYSVITSVSINTRYVTIFSKYLPEPPVL